MGITATCIAEATAIAAAGADFVVAQGWEAGGHRGRFDTTEIDQEQDLLVLVQAMAERISLPIVAAGGLMTGGDIATVLSAGATAAQLGTAFLCCPEATYQRHRTCCWPKSPGTRYSLRRFLGVLRGVFKIGSLMRCAVRSYWNFPCKTA